MANHARISTTAVELVEDLLDGCEGAQCDQLRALYVMLMDLDEAVGWTVTMLRCGPGSSSLRRRMAERGLTVMEGGRPDGPRAA